MHQKLPLESWARRQHYEFFCSLDEPYFGITASVDVTKAYASYRNLGVSFYVFYLHKSLKAVNSIVPFKYRIERGEVLIYEQIHASATVDREDGTFGFSFIEYDEDITKFAHNVSQEVQRVRACNELFPQRNGTDAVHYSSIPWIKFTSLSHARSYNNTSSEPKISFGQIYNEGNMKFMPCAVHVHHGLMDGRDVGDYFKLFQDLLDE